MNTPPVEFRRGIATMRYKRKTIVQITDTATAYPNLELTDYTVSIYPLNMLRRFQNKEEAIDVAVVWYNRLTLQR